MRLHDELEQFKKDSAEFREELRLRDPPVVLPGDKERAEALFLRLKILVEGH